MTQMKNEMEIKPFQPQTIKKVWGDEIIIANDQYCGKILVLKMNYRCSVHMHKMKTETFYFMEGLCLFEWCKANRNNEDNIVHKYIMPVGSCITLEPRVMHRFSGIAQVTKILEVSTKDLPEDSYRNTQSEYVDGGSVKWSKNKIWQFQ